MKYFIVGKELESNENTLSMVQVYRSIDNMLKSTTNGGSSLKVTSGGSSILDGVMTSLVDLWSSNVLKNNKHVKDNNYIYDFQLSINHKTIDIAGRQVKGEYKLFNMKCNNALPASVTIIPKNITLTVNNFNELVNMINLAFSDDEVIKLLDTSAELSKLENDNNESENDNNESENEHGWFDSGINFRFLDKDFCNKVTSIGSKLIKRMEKGVNAFMEDVDVETKTSTESSRCNSKRGNGEGHKCSNSCNNEGDSCANKNKSTTCGESCNSSSEDQTKNEW